VVATDEMMSEIARRLGIGRSTLYRKMKEYGFVEANKVGAPTGDGHPMVA
jgi:DNA-binding NtrC family response regulator